MLYDKTEINYTLSLMNKDILNFEQNHFIR